MSFVSLDDIPTTEVVPDTNEHDREPVYQIQGKFNTNIAHLVHVGNFARHPHIAINEFELGGGIHCQTVSCFMMHSDLKRQSKLPLIRIRISKNDGKELHTYAHLVLIFNTFEHIRREETLVDWISTEDKEVDMKGFYTVELRIGDKMYIVDKIKLFPSKNSVVAVLAEQLTTEFVLSKLKEEIKE